MKTFTKAHSAILLAFTAAVILLGARVAYLDASEAGRALAMAWVALYIGAITAACTWALSELAGENSKPFPELFAICSILCYCIGLVIGFSGSVLAVLGGVTFGYVLRGAKSPHSAPHVIPANK